MGVPCTGCGREYDVALFQFGRTIHCTCGERVGLAARVRMRAPSHEIRFFADAMLGRLAHWLRILGFDVAYEGDLPDESLVRRALTEGRVILTRDRALPVQWRVEDVHLVASELPFEQLREVVRTFGLADRVRVFTRCSRCNTRLRSAPPEEVRGLVPPRVLASQSEFRRCAGCGRVYWHGSHTVRMKRVVERILAET
jgi:uncharacterized protein with PIN domain